MLSRAVEGQLNEQRELMSAISDMRTQLMRLGQELAELRVRPPQDEASDAAINNVTVEMREAVRFLSERLDGVTRVVGQRGEELGDIRTALTAIDAHVRSQAETLGVLSAGLQALPSYGERVSALQDTVQGLHGQLTHIEAELASAKDDSLREQVVGLHETVQVVHGQLTTIETGLESSNDDATGDRLSAAVVDAVAPLSGRLDEVSDMASAQSALLAQLQASAAQLQQTLAAVQARIEPIATDVTAIGGEVAGLVEGSADGAAMDARVSESVTAAVRNLERRLTEHVDEAVLALAETLLRRRAGSATGSADEPGSTGFERPDLGAQAPSAWSSSVGSTPEPAGGGTDADEAEADAGDGFEFDEPDAVGLGDDDLLAEELEADDVSVDVATAGAIGADDLGGGDLSGDDVSGAAASADGPDLHETDDTAPDDDDDGGDTDTAPPAYWSKPTPDETGAATDDPDQTGEISATPLRSWTPQTPGSSEPTETTETESGADPESSGKRKRWWNRG
jgi:hypothetical protein